MRNLFEYMNIYQHCNKTWADYNEKTSLTVATCPACRMSVNSVNYFMVKRVVATSTPNPPLFVPVVSQDTSEYSPVAQPLPV